MADMKIHEVQGLVDIFYDNETKHISDHVTYDEFMFLLKAGLFYAEFMEKHKQKVGALAKMILRAQKDFC